MADQFAEQFKRYWAIIVTVASIMGGSSVALFTIQMQTNQQIAEVNAGLRELRATVGGALINLNEFKQRTEATRFTADDAKRDGKLRDVEHERLWDAIENLKTERQ